MERDRWERIREQFDAAAELPRDRQRAFLQDACHEDPSLVEEVLEMLEEDSRDGFLLDGKVADLAAKLFDDPLPPPFREFGPYRILRLLGEGGMGVVFLAERIDLGNQVAIKILRDGRLSPARLRRFAAEQRTLAELNHPSIARLYDADALPDGTPWFVMEYVDGLPLTEYCRKHECSLEHRLKLFRAVCEAVEYAHQHTVIHRDLKPSNILVKEDGSVRLLDFGIAHRLDANGVATDLTRTGLSLMTPAYAAPEQIRGERAGVQSDVYSLGVILYELLARRLPISAEEPAKPSTYAETRTASWIELDVLCLTAMRNCPERRYSSVAALIRDIDHYSAHEPLEARADSLAYTLAKFTRRNWHTVAAVGLTAALILFAVAVAPRFRPSASTVRPRAKTIAVLPFKSPANQPELEFLSLAIPEEIARVLGYARSLSVRPFDTSRRYMDPHTNPQQAGRDMRVGTIVTGEYAKGVDQLQIVLTAIDVETNRYFWRETIRVPDRNAIELQAQIAAKTREGLAPLLGATEFSNAVSPKNEEAYDLFLRASGLYSDPADVKTAIALFHKSLALDPTYAPAWAGLAVRYRLEGWYSGGCPACLERAESAAERALSFDPNNVDAARGLIVSRTGRGEVFRAFQEATDLLKRRPDNEQGHFAMSYVLRYAGLLDEAAHECDAVLLIDSLNAGNRSCGILFILRGNYAHAMDFINLDTGSEWAQTFTMENLLRQGKMEDAVTQGPKNVPQWAAFSVLFAFLQHEPAEQVENRTHALKAEGDAEANYLAAGHLAYAGQTEAAMKLLGSAIRGGYCSYPSMDFDPLFANARHGDAYARVHAAGRACQEKFLAQRGGNQADLLNTR